MAYSGISYRIKGENMSFRVLKRSFFIVFTVLQIGPLAAQSKLENEWAAKLKHFKIETQLAMQYWAAYSFGQQVYDEQTAEYVPVDDRLNFHIRRSRLAFKAKAYERLKINITAALDLVGRDELAATEGGFNNGGSPRFRAWNAYVQWKLQKSSEQFVFTTGYFLPQIGRASMTAALRSNSMEKAWSQNYLRRHMSGSGPGRVTGINLGGLILKDGRKINYKYDVGIYSSTFGANTNGPRSSPTVLGRMEVFVGDPEQKQYQLGRRVNFFGQRNGLSVALAAAHQGAQAQYQANNVFSFDFLFNSGPFQMDGEIHLLQRTGELSSGIESRQAKSENLTGYWRMGYNIYLPNGQVIEPIGMWMFFYGALEQEAQKEAMALGTPTAQEVKWNLGANWYLNQNLKISFFYTFRQANAGEAELPLILNNFYGQPGSNLAFLKGDWLGLGLVAII